MKHKESQLTHPELPYAGTSGHSGTDTSRERALKSDSSGETAARQRETLNLLEGKGFDGLTWRELASLLQVHHGTASGVLSVLHKSGRVARLKQRRNGCKVYVLSSWVFGRETERQGGKRLCPHCGGSL